MQVTSSCKSVWPLGVSCTVIDYNLIDRHGILHQGAMHTCRSLSIDVPLSPTM